MYALISSCLEKSGEIVVQKKIGSTHQSKALKKKMPYRKDGECLGSHNSQLGSGFTFKRRQ